MKEINRALKIDHGFSLVELMIIIAVIGVLASTAVPSILNWLPGYRLRTAADDLFSRLQQAKIQSARLDSEVAVSFNRAANTYQVISGGPDRIFNGQPAPQGDDVVLNTSDLTGYGSGVRFGPGDATQNVTGNPFGANPWDYLFGGYVLFDPKGIVFETGYVYLRNDEGACVAVGTPTLAGAIAQRKWRNGIWE